MLGGGSGFGNHLTPVIMTTGAAHMMGKLRFATVWAFHMTNSLQGIMGTAHIAAGFRGLFLRDSHLNYSLPRAKAERRIS
jgi:hypothetical protein